ncbi:ferritin family protein [Heliorestis convoluta]|uniref:Ferritin-like domain-containing protein n=1 Tax=Heliorestis convoluta TaxID=356322 RepID=A0A5Q2N0Y3_9FIRM|nr:ferritin-like domain-containing protein [Heliorestis convoluta]QGG49014.1 ferritin-like domain-containing protein [Heliorestis convoluta]
MAGFDDSSYERLYHYANPALGYHSHKSNNPQRHHETPLHHHGTNSPLADKIAKAVVGEYQAIHFYTRLVELAPTMEARQIIRDILIEERRDHYRSFVEIYRNLTGRQAKVVTGALPATYAEGLKMAIREELQSVADYQAISEMATDPYIVKVFASAAMDEQRHASWLLYLWMSLITKG